MLNASNGTVLITKSDMIMSKCLQPLEIPSRTYDIIQIVRSFERLGLYSDSNLGHNSDKILLDGWSKVGNHLYITQRQSMHIN